MNVTAHFRIDEFGLPPDGRELRSDFSPTSYPALWVNDRLKLLCEALEVLREELGGKPIRILSGYRPPAYNRAIGGALRSQHMEGRAADIRVDGLAPRIVHDTALRLARTGAMRFGGLGSYPAFTHVDVRGVSKNGTLPRLVRWSGGRPAS